MEPSEVDFEDVVAELGLFEDPEFCKSHKIDKAKVEAIQNGQPVRLKELLEVDCRIDESYVVAACEQNDRDLVRVLLDFGWDINQLLSCEIPLLFKAVGNLTFMQWLLQNGANLYAKSQLGASVLSAAIAYGNADVVQFLLSQDLDVTQGDLLHYAAERQNQEEGAALVDVLANRGADVNAYRYHNETAFRWRGLFKLPTPLHVAVRNSNVPVVEALLRNGADRSLGLFNVGRETPSAPLDKANEMGNQALITALQAPKE